MAEYYPLLAKAVGSLPNSTSETRRVVYERARKALIGQLRTLHPPVPEEDIERESVALDRAIERIETELAASSSPASASIPAAPPGAAEPAPVVPDAVAPTPPSAPAPRPSGALGPLAARKPIAPLRPRVPKPAALETASPGLAAAEPATSELAPPATPPEPPAEPVVLDAPAETPAAASSVKDVSKDAGATIKPRLEAQRPIAPQPPTPEGPKRRIWIIPVCVGVVVLIVALAAWKLRVKPEAARTNAVATQPQPENGKIADRVGGARVPDDKAAGEEPQSSSSEAPAPPSAPNPQPAAPAQTTQQPTPQPANPELPVAYRAALLVEAPDLPSKVQTFPGTVVWKLNNVNAGPSDAVGLSVEADIDLPEDKTKAVITFEKNTDSSLPASHTIKVRFIVGPGSYSGDIKQISVPQMRREGNSDGEPLAGVTVPVIANSFLVGLSPGNAETANLRLIGDMPWIDIPILLNSGKIAKLTFEKGAAGQREIAEALAEWQKQ